MPKFEFSQCDSCVGKKPSTQEFDRVSWSDLFPVWWPQTHLPDGFGSADFMMEVLSCGRRFRTFNMFDEANCEVMHIKTGTSINLGRLVRIFGQRHVPKGYRRCHASTMERSS